MREILFFVCAHEIEFIFRWYYFAWLSCLFDFGFIVCVFRFELQCKDANVNIRVIISGISHNALQLDWIYHCSNFVFLRCETCCFLLQWILVNELAVIEFERMRPFCIPVTERIHSFVDLKLDMASWNSIICVRGFRATIVTRFTPYPFRIHILACLCVSNKRPEQCDQITETGSGQRILC